MIGPEPARIGHIRSLRSFTSRPDGPAYGELDRMFAGAAADRIWNLSPTAAVELRAGAGHLVGDSAALMRRQLAASEL
jgi:hypothetical protein